MADIIETILIRLNALESHLASTSIQPRSEYTGGVARIPTVDLPSAGQNGRIYFDLTTSHLVVDAAGAWEEVYYASDPFVLATYTVGTLPTGVIGQLVWVSNGRKGGEGVGAGTGVVAFWNTTTTNWMRVEDNTQVQA